MNLVSNVSRTMKNPFETWVRLQGKISRQGLFEKYSRKAVRQGMKRPGFILSFDCDTDRDIEVVTEVHSKLREFGITPVYAVPGELLERGVETYRKIAATGAEFINHGYAAHTLYHAKTRSYESTFFYEKLTQADIAEDVRRGHTVLTNTLGVTPRGFRTPHFGGYQRRSQLETLYKVLRELGYQFSTSTAPLYGFRNGPASQPSKDFYEIPVTGCFDMPLMILDSYSFRFEPKRAHSETDYAEQFRKMLGFFMQEQRPGLLNYYADPSQVHDWPLFFELMKEAAPIAIKSYTQFLQGLR